MTRTEPLHYNLDDRPPGLKLWLYTLQFLAFSVANSAVVPVVVGTALGLDAAGIASLVQRTFFFCALGSLLQVWLGHGYPIFEGPAGVWYTVFIALASIAGAVDKPLGVLRTDLELGLLVAGGVTVALGAFGVMGKVVRVFTPLVNGVFLCVMGLQLSSSIVKGMLGAGVPGSSTAAAFAISVVTVVTAMWFTFKGRGFVASIGILMGTAGGWVVAWALGAAPAPRWESSAVVSLPELLAWGRPTYDVGILLTCVLAGLVVLANLVASVVGMAELTGTAADARRLNRGALFTGVSDVLGGIGSVVGFIPYASSLGLVAVSRVSARLPFVLSAIVLVVLSLLPVVGDVIAALPRPVGYAILLVTFSQVLVLGLKNFARTGLDPRSGFVIGISMMLGIGIMGLPAAQLQNVPAWARYIVSNGLLVATAVSAALEYALVPRAVAARVPAANDAARKEAVR